MRLITSPPLPRSLSLAARHGGDGDSDSSGSDSDEDHGDNDEETSASLTSSSSPSATSTGSSTNTSRPPPTTTVTSTSSTTPSSASPPLPPTPTPSSPTIQLTTPSNVTTCQDMTLSWSYVGSGGVPLTISVDGVPPQNNTVSHTLTTTTPSTDQRFSWTPVDVPEGQYTISATDTPHTFGIAAKSQPFFVVAGSNVSCLTGSSSSSTAPSPTASSTATRTSPASRPISKGDEIGVIVGVIAGILLLVSAFVVPRIRKWLARRRAVRSRQEGPYYLF
ncbi:hypothetical protein PLICRDRAFT_175462 [Plicaturopsis crispa FD-325 SS-3]|nr:hypothetical protein PLICRDRAFT_175462 [Plicaturopsis crispa FD-325 SS-3]